MKHENSCRCLSCLSWQIMKPDHLEPTAEGRPEKQQDAINPDHYKIGGIEMFQILRAKLSPEGFKGYLAGCVFKYMARYEHKGGLQDLNKAKRYLEELIEFYEESKNPS